MDLDFIKSLKREELIEFNTKIQKAIQEAWDNLPPKIIDSELGPFCTDISLTVCPSCRELFGKKRPGAKHREDCVYMNLKKKESEFNASR